jgi:hypothetical protein
VGLAQACTLSHLGSCALYAQQSRYRVAATDSEPLARVWQPSSRFSVYLEKYPAIGHKLQPRSAQTLIGLQLTPGQPLRISPQPDLPNPYR